MKLYQIFSKNGLFMGTYEGDNETEAVAAMHRDAGYDVTAEDEYLIFDNENDAETCGHVDAYEIEEV